LVAVLSILLILHVAAVILLRHARAWSSSSAIARASLASASAAGAVLWD
jgi:hypothetical protein